MDRLKVTPREGYVREVESQGLSYHARDGYWTEDSCYRFSAGEIDVLEAATDELHRMYGEALDRIIRTRRLSELAIPEAFHSAIEASWQRRDHSVYGRFDLAYDGTSPPKLLEYNADTPTSLLESSIIQWYWKVQVRPSADQFNSIHEKLVAGWASAAAENVVSIACLADQEEDWVTCAYLLDTLAQAEVAGELIDVSDLAWDSSSSFFLNSSNQVIPTLFKLYPWEWMMLEEFGRNVEASRTKFIEPIYKAALASKAMLAIMWEFYPGHPNLLEATFEQGRWTSYARKPFFSREGQNVTLVRDGLILDSTGGSYGREGYVFQKLSELPDFDGYRPVIGSWVIGGRSAGIGIRESQGLITNDKSRFVPHFFEPSGSL